MAFRRILRIPNYNHAEEEPNYWRQYGQALYQHSERLHREGTTAEDRPSNIPPDILADFLERRTKNHALNHHYLEALGNGKLHYLTYCQDDTGPYGLNVQEAQSLSAKIAEGPLGMLSHVQTGADEVAACMLARWMALQQTQPPVVYPVYSADAGRRLVARFDGLPIETVVEKAILACGARVARQSAEIADVSLLVHAPAERQGDHAIGDPARLSDSQTEDALAVVERSLALGRPLAIADVAWANGADSRLVEGMLTRFDDLTGLYGYAGWNTPGNAIGTAVAMGLIRHLAERQESFHIGEFCRLMLIRLADDWLYQADVRSVVRRELAMAGHSSGSLPAASLDEARLNVHMADGLFLLKSRLGLEDTAIRCYYPCGRTFEVGIQIQ